jgi:hypothetical protein
MMTTQNPSLFKAPLAHEAAQYTNPHIQQRRAAFQQPMGRPPTEREFLKIIANVIADTVNPRWSEDVRRRRMTIVRGRGRVHGQNRDLGREFGLTDQPF